MRVVDVNAGWGAPAVPGIDEYWVVDQAARQLTAAPLDEVRPSPGHWRPCCVALPEPVSMLERRLAQIGDRCAPAALWLYPGHLGHGYPLEPWAMSPLPEFAERMNLSLVIDFGALPAFPWSEIVSFARAYPRLPILAIGAPLRGPAAAHALDATANLILDTSRMADDDAPRLALLASTCGAHRLALGGGTMKRVAAVRAAVGVKNAEIVLGGTAARIGDGSWGDVYL